MDRPEPYPWGFLEATAAGAYADYQVAAAIRLVRVLHHQGISLTLDGAAHMWAYWSESACATWLVLPEEEDYLAKVASRAWCAWVRAAKPLAEED